ncbi:MAG: hypothetical protein IJ104_09440 [Methanobrevibacter sp.]|nr:hypothetical protein [Methanobrevibacter sp.]
MEHHKEIIKTLGKTIDEKMIAETLLMKKNNITHLIKIGESKDLDCDVKNEMFDGIYKDSQQEVIIDIRLTDHILDKTEIAEIEPYWKALVETYNKPVAPIFIMIPK